MDSHVMPMPMLGVCALQVVWPKLALCLPRLISPQLLKQLGRRARGSNGLP